MAVNGVCLLVAGVLRATLPGSEFTLAWDHSVEKTRWEERYRVEGNRLLLVEASIKGSGAGMEAPPNAVLHDGRWTWQPMSTHAELRLTHSTFTSDYALCVQGQCADLGSRVGTTSEGDVVSVRACR